MHLLVSKPVSRNALAAFLTVSRNALAAFLLGRALDAEQQNGKQ
jgi:hypothetical protein